MVDYNDINYKHLNKEIFQIEVPSSVAMPNFFFVVSYTKNHKRYYSNELKRILTNYQKIRRTNISISGKHS